MIRYILGTVLKLEGLFLLLPCIFAIFYRESEGFVYLFVSGACILLGEFFSKHKPTNTIFYLKEGCIATSLSWILMSIAGGLPFYFTREIPSLTDALFETVSGFTTTGASILNDIEALSHCSLFWRSFTHWIGGMGVLVFLLAIIPMSGGSNINLMRAESPGPSVGKLVPKLRHTARILYGIYISLTLLEIVLLLLGQMSLFESICTAVGTAGTGGFGIKNDSIASYSPYIQWVVTIFMILFGINFNAYYFILFGQVKKAFKMEEVRGYLLIILVSIIIIAVDIFHMCEGLFDAITKSAFQVASIITTAGFATTDFNLWPQTSRVILVLLMFVGACAGSTGGGIKVSRFIIALKAVGREVYTYIHPKSIKKVIIEKKEVEEEIIHSVTIYFITFITIFVASILLISLEGKDLVTTFTSVATTLNNVGPGLELVGPTQNFGHFTDFSKWVFIFNMLAGRLELFPLLIIFHPIIWKEFFYEISKKKQ